MKPVIGNVWKLVLFRGILAILFALVAIFLPTVAFSTIILFFGAWLVINGALTIIGSVQSRSEDPNWWITLLAGIAGVLLGAYTYLNPQVTAAAIIIYIAIWCIIIGVAEIVFAIRIRKLIQGEGWLIAGGILSVIFGLLLLANPIQGGLTLTLLLGIYMLFIGIFFMILAFRIKRLANSA